jgi:Endosomal/lysosomal potassium channel TMEM175
VFGFAATLLVVALEVPQTFAELTASLRGFVAFAFSFAMLVLIWATHNSFFRRYGLQDTWTVLINSVLLFVVLFYVYPLKFLATALSSMYLGVGPEKPMIAHQSEMAWLMIIYAIGFIAVFACFFLLYRHAGTCWQELGLDEIERLDARAWSYHYLIFVAVGCLSIAIVLAGGPLWLSGVSYGLLGPLCYGNGVVARRRAVGLEERASEARSD